MEALIMLPFIGALALSSIGLGVFLVRAQLRGKQRRAAQWMSSAAHLGLSFTERGSLSSHVPGRMIGERAGFDVVVAVRTVGGGRNNSPSHFTFAQARFPRPLDLGLSLSPKVGVPFVSSPEIGIDYADALYTTRTAEPELTRRLFAHPAVYEAFVALHAHGPRLRIDDESATYEIGGIAFEPRELAPLLDSALEMARRIWAARFEVGPSMSERAVREVWSGVAHAVALDVDVDGTRIRGRYQGHAVEIDAVLRGQARHTVFTVRFDRPLGVSLSLHRQRALHAIGRFLGLQDIRVGDPVFDARFVVKGRPEDQVRALLTEEVRAALVALQDHASELRVEDDHLEAEVSWLVCDAGALRSGIDTVVHVASTMVEVDAGSAGPYRR